MNWNLRGISAFLMLFFVFGKPGHRKSKNTDTTPILSGATRKSIAFESHIKIKDNEADKKNLLLDNRLMKGNRDTMRGDHVAFVNTSSHTVPPKGEKFLQFHFDNDKMDQIHKSNKDNEHSAHLDNRLISSRPSNKISALHGTVNKTAGSQFLSSDNNADPPVMQANIVTKYSHKEAVTIPSHLETTTSSSDGWAQKLNEVFFDGSNFHMGAGLLQSFQIKRSPHPSVGFPLPLPLRFVSSSSHILTVDSSLGFLTTSTSSILQLAIARYRRRIFVDRKDVALPISHAAFQSFISKPLRHLEITVSGACDQHCYPNIDSDESYKLDVDRSGAASIVANEVWGALRGLHTFSQLIYKIGPNQFRINQSLTDDQPRYRHRGIMIDSSRHFLRKQSILDNLDIMEQNKMNVLHWHISDDQSFPFKGYNAPELSKGAFSKHHVYTPSDFKEIVEYARLRGIRIVPEIDTPGHVLSWNNADPLLLSKCHNPSGQPTGDVGPLNPIYNGTYRLLKRLFKEFFQIFPDQFFHSGGDEVPTECWLTNPDIKEFFKINWAVPGDQEAARQILDYYFKRLAKVFQATARATRRRNMTYVFWQEVFDNGMPINPNKTVIHVWKDGSNLVQYLLSRNFRVIFSTCWYLNYISYGNDWYKYYQCSPLDEFLANGDGSTEPSPYTGQTFNEELLLGGEACMWGEWIDDTNLISTLWPRASAVAERLWSSKNVSSITAAAPRMEEQRCRLLGLGYSAAPLSGPGACYVADDKQWLSDRDSFWALKFGRSMPHEHDRLALHWPRSENPTLVAGPYLLGIISILLIYYYLVQTSSKTRHSIVPTHLRLGTCTPCLTRSRKNSVFIILIVSTLTFVTATYFLIG